MWESPDVVDHIEERTDYRLHNLFEKLIINSEKDYIGEYKYDTTGETVTKLEIYDVSCPALMNNYQELQDMSSVYTMTYKDNYTTPQIAYDQYKNITLNSLVLLMNRMYSNSEFVMDSSEEFKMLEPQDVTNLIMRIDKNDVAHTVHEVQDPEEYAQHIKEMNQKRDDHDPILDRLFSNRFNQELKDVEKTLGYKRLCYEIGEDKVKENLMKLTSYYKKG
jgi:hypothetical protein